jgi:O-antigen/teichoic acid export membrane protein
VKQEQDNHNLKDSEYNGALKYIGLFGGVQGIVSIITMLKAVIVSHLLGTIGVGVNDVYNRSIDLGKKITDLGISYSAVQAISEQCGESHSQDHVEYAIKVVRSWSLWLSIFGTLLFFFLAPLLSRWSFEGNPKYTFMFRLLSLTIGCSALMGGELAVLKGARMLGRMAWYQSISAVMVLSVAIPCYYIWRIDGVVPSLLLSAIALLAVACWHSFRVFPYRVALFSRKVIIDGLYIIRQGINYTLAGFFNSGAFYLVSIYVFKQGDASDLGCYSYGTLLISYLTMLVFAALDNEFFPRLSAVNKDTRRSSYLVNNQVEILMVVVTPLIVCFATCLPLIVLLFDDKFAPLVTMAQLGVIGLFFKALMHPAASISLSKGESRTFLLQEALSYSFMVVAMIGGFKYYGLEGLGIGMLLSNLFDWVSVWIIAKVRYKFSYSRCVWKLFVSQLPILIFTMFVCMYTKDWEYVGLSVAIVAWSATYSIRFIHNNTDITKKILSKLRRKQ